MAVAGGGGGGGGVKRELGRMVGHRFPADIRTPLSWFFGFPSKPKVGGVEAVAGRWDRGGKTVCGGKDRDGGSSLGEKPGWGWADGWKGGGRYSPCGLRRRLPPRQGVHGRIPPLPPGLAKPPPLPERLLQPREGRRGGGAVGESPLSSAGR